MPPIPDIPGYGIIIMQVVDDLWMAGCPLTSSLKHFTLNGRRPWVRSGPPRLLVL